MQHFSLAGTAVPRNLAYNGGVADTAGVAVQAGSEGSRWAPASGYAGVAMFILLVYAEGFA